MGNIYEKIWLVFSVGLKKAESGLKRAEKPCTKSCTIFQKSVQKQAILYTFRSSHLLL